MDDRKWFSKKIITYLLLTAIGFSLLIVLYGGFVYWQTQNIEDPKKCFKTKMFEVYLCPSSQSYLRYNEVPKHFFQALILSEDASFWSHKGFDWFEIKESFRRNILEWKYARGGSTLTQQLAKNLYLKPNKSLDRKFKEFFIAKQIEEKLSKSQILEKYVNVVEFGQNIFGLKNGAHHYFGKHPSQLTVIESIYLISLLPSPKRLGKSFEQKKLSSENIWRMEVILKRMFRTQKIDQSYFETIRDLIKEEDWPFYQFNLQPGSDTLTEKESEELQQELEEALSEDPINADKELEGELLESTDQQNENINDETSIAHPQGNSDSITAIKQTQEGQLEQQEPEGPSPQQPTTLEYPEKNSNED